MSNEYYDGAFEDDDIEVYDRFLQECRRIFIERKKEYGDHRKKTAFYHQCGLGEKLIRATDDISMGRILKEDTAHDLVNYIATYMTCDEIAKKRK